MSIDLVFIVHCIQLAVAQHIVVYFVVYFDEFRIAKRLFAVEINQISEGLVICIF